MIAQTRKKGKTPFNYLGTENYKTWRRERQEKGLWALGSLRAPSARGSKPDKRARQAQRYASSDEVQPEKLGRINPV